MNMRYCGIVALLACSTMALAGGKATGRSTPLLQREVAGAMDNAKFERWQATSRGAAVSAGTYTTLEGWYDWQANGGSPQYIRVDSVNGSIHVTYMMAEDSSNVSGSRRSAYALSTDDGATWNNFGNVRVPPIRSGYPSLDLLRPGPGAALPILANHNVGGGTDVASWVYVGDSTGLFTELSPLPPLGTLDGGEPIWPAIAAGSDGSIIVHSSNTSTPEDDYENYITRTTDFGSNWSSWLTVPAVDGSGGRNPMKTNGAGRVGALTNADSLILWESTNDGVSWNPQVTVFPPLVPNGAETLGVWVGVDLAYAPGATEPIVAFNSSRTSDGNLFSFAGSRILVWSPTLGIRTAVPWDSLKYPTTMVPQSNHLSLGWPAIAYSGSSIVIAFQGFLDNDLNIDTLASGMLFGEIFMVQSTDGGNTWSLPVNITNTPQLDERYPSISSWNPAGSAYLTWQEDTRAGSHAFTDGSPKSLSKLVFYKANLNQLFPANDLMTVGITMPTSSQPVKQGSAFDPKAVFRNIGLAAQSAIPVHFEILDGANTVMYSNTQTIASLAAAASAEVTFASVSGSLLTTGTYTARAIAANPGDVSPANDTTVTTFQVIPVVPVAGTYTEDFEDAASETGGYGWYTAVLSGNGTSDWVRGTPAKVHMPGAHGGAKCYVTGLTENYTNGLESVLGSPVFDLSSMSGNVELQFWQNFEFEPMWDGGWLQYSTDGGQTWITQDHQLGSGGTFDTPVSTGWYNAAVDSDVVAGAPDPPMWGDNTSVYAGNVNGWIRSTTVLPVGGQADVRLRWYMSADGSVSYEGWAIDDVQLSPATSVEQPDDGSLPKTFALYQNYPNPFNPSTTIRFALPVESSVSVDVFNALGQRVKTLASGMLPAGYRSVEWNGTGNGGAQLGSGVYFVRFTATGIDGRSFGDTRKLMLLK
jgi:hypothetical protein